MAPHSSLSACHLKKQSTTCSHTHTLKHKHTIVSTQLIMFSFVGSKLCLTFVLLSLPHSSIYIRINYKIMLNNTNNVMWCVYTDLRVIELNSILQSLTIRSVYADRQVGRQSAAGRETERQRERQTGRQTDWKTGRLGDRQKDMQSDRQRDRQTILFFQDF